MKRISMVLLFLVLCFTISACGQADDDRTDHAVESTVDGMQDDSRTNEPEETVTNEKVQEVDGGIQNEQPNGADIRQGAEDSGPSAESSILVVYFSLADEQYEVGVIEKGNTQIIAEMIAEQTGADTFSIESTVAYPTTYDGLLEISREEESNPPKIAGTVENMDDYSVIFIGYPIWWGDLPTIVTVFLESYDFSGKTVIPFCTHAGSGLSGTQGTVEKLCEGATVEGGLAVSGRTAQNDRDSAESAVTDWLRGLGYIE